MLTRGEFFRTGDYSVDLARKKAATRRPDVVGDRVRPKRRFGKREKAHYFQKKKTAPGFTTH